MSTNLRDFIKSVRACKTAAEEREVVARESAALRSAFKDDTANYRHRNIAKLMFIHMLGYPTHFGQMECLKLIASVGFPEKRMGYLGLMLLLDEKQEVLMLATNSIKNDFHNSNQFIVGLALSAFANICSAEMASDLAAEIQTLFQHTNPYIRKKAALCCVRIVRKVPDLMESLTNPAASLLSDKHHGVLITGVKLCIVLCQSNPIALEHFKKSNPIALEHFKKQTSSLVGLLRNVVNSGYTAEYDVSGVPDPFLQIELLRLLRIVGKGDPDSSDIMTDILAQVATNTDCSKIPGSAILYECIQTIMNIECTVGLRVLAVNILGRFLPNKDNNIRYVALNMLAKVVGMDTQAVQRHRLVIVECVRDSDVSIRRRALELVCALVNENNVQTLTTELLEYLKVCDPEFKGDLTIKICSLVQKLAPSKVWYVERMVELMLQAGRFITKDIVHTALVIISNASEFHGYIVKLLYHAFQQWSGQECLALVTIWCIGEYGEFLLNHQGEDDLAITESDAVDFLERLLNDSRSSPVVKAFALTALLKLSSRYVSFTEKIKELISKYKDSVVAELQQRAVEYSRILEKNENLRIHVTRKMPVLDEASYQTKRLDDALHSGGIISNASPPPTEKGATALNEDKHSSVKSLANLLDITNEEPSSQVQKQAGDILQDLLGFCSDIVSNNVQDQGPTYASIVAFESSGLKITFDFMKPTDNLQTTVINATCVNTSSNSYTNFSLQAAVPKFLLLSLDSASGTVVPPGDNLTQVLTITNSMHGQKPLIMRLKISYTMLGQEIVDQCQIDRFPAGL